MHNCPYCKTLLYDNTTVCPNCNMPQQELPPRNTTLVNMTKFQPIYDMITERNVDDFVDIYMGKKAPFYRERTFSWPAFLLGPIYMAYMKMWNLTTYLIIIYLVCFFNLKYGIFITLFVSIFAAYKFKLLYVISARKKVDKFIRENERITDKELKELCEKKGKKSLKKLISYYGVLNIIVVAIVFFLSLFSNIKFDTDAARFYYQNTKKENQFYKTTNDILSNLNAKLEYDIENGNTRGILEVVHKNSYDIEISETLDCYNIRQLLPASDEYSGVVLFKEPVSSEDKGEYYIYITDGSKSFDGELISNIKFNNYKEFITRKKTTADKIKKMKCESRA